MYHSRLLFGFCRDDDVKGEGKIIIMMMIENDRKGMFVWRKNWWGLFIISQFLGIWIGPFSQARPLRFCVPSARIFFYWSLLQKKSPISGCVKDDDLKLFLIGWIWKYPYQCVIYNIIILNSISNFFTFTSFANLMFLTPSSALMSLGPSYNHIPLLHHSWLLTDTSIR